LPSTPISLETENGPEPQEIMEYLGFPATAGPTMASTKTRVEIGTTGRWLPVVDTFRTFAIKLPLKKPVSAGAIHL
jgi:hypothetical protein